MKRWIQLSSVHLSKSPSTNIEWNDFGLYLGPQFEPIKICSSFEDVSHRFKPIIMATGSTCSRLLSSRRICSVEGRWCLGLWLLGSWEVVCWYLQTLGCISPLRDKVFEAILQGQFGRFRWVKIGDTKSDQCDLRIVKGDPMFINKKVLLSLYELIGFSFTNKSV